MSNRNFELEYDEYVERRNAEFKPTSRRSSKFLPIDNEKEKKSKNFGEYGLPSNEYKMQGYDETSSDIGSDSIGSIRTLRNNLRVMSLEHRDRDEPVKSHLCKTACEQLSITEQKLVDLSHQKSEAMLRGNTKKSEAIGQEMERIKSDAIRTTYSDLIIDDKTLKAFGINSKWTPDKNPNLSQPWRPITPITTQKPKSPTQRDRTPSRQTIRLRPESRRNSFKRQNNEPVLAETNEKPKSFRKNQRLSTIANVGTAIPVDVPIHGGSTVQDDPFKMPTYVGRCPHCLITENGLGKAGEMEKHYARYCKVMTSCKYCLKVTMVSQLTEHLIYRCEFLKGSMSPCNICGLAINKIDQRNSKSHPMCRGRKPPTGAQWCPLCTIGVENSEAGWREHLMNNCYNNPRRDGPEKDPYEIKQEQDFYLNRLEEEKQRIKDEEKADKMKNQMKTTTTTTTKLQGYSGRLIDADKLISALQEIQERKKMEKKRRIKEAEKLEAGNS